MGTIVRFLFRLRLLFLFILLELVAVVLIVEQSAYHQAAYFNSSNAVSAGLYQKLADITYFFSLRTVNDSLAAENSRLLTLLKQDSSVNSVDSAAKSLSDPSLHYQSARVVNSTTAFRNNYLTLNQGALQGVKPRMAVVSAQGVVGIVKDVSDNYATAISLLNKNARISAQHAKSGTAGTIIWPGGSYRHAQLIEIPIHVNIKVGDSITTSSYSNIFPESIFIGRVSRVEKKDGASTFEIKVKLGVDYKQLSFVHLVNHSGQAERDTLESKLNYDE